MPFLEVDGATLRSRGEQELNRGERTSRRRRSADRLVGRIGVGRRWAPSPTVAVVELRACRITSPPPSTRCGPPEPTPPSSPPCAGASSSSTTRRRPAAGDVLEPLPDLPRARGPARAVPRSGRGRCSTGSSCVKLNGGLGTSMGLSGPKSLLERQARHELPRRDRDAGPRAARAVRGPAAAAADELAVDAGPVAGGAAALRRPARAGRAAGLPAGPRAQAARRRPAAGGVAGQPGPRVVPARARRPLHRAGRDRHPGPPARRRPALVLRVELGQPRRARRRADRGVGRRRGACRSRWRPCAARRPTARAATSRCATARWCCARPRRCPRATRRSARSTGGATTTRTTCGSTCRRCKELQAADPAAPELPLIVNRKTVDPRDKSSTKVIQLETAMGAAVGSIPGARAVQVPRSRFAPVKTTNDLLVVRSDAYELTAGRADDADVRRRRTGRHARRRPLQAGPRLREAVPRGRAVAAALHPASTVEGDVTFGAGRRRRGRRARDRARAGSPTARCCADERTGPMTGPAERVETEFTETFGGEAGRPLVGARPGQPDRRAHRLQRRVRAAARAAAGGGGRRPGRGRARAAGALGAAGGARSRWRWRRSRRARSTAGRPTSRGVALGAARGRPRRAGPGRRRRRRRPGRGGAVVVGGAGVRRRRRVERPRRAGAVARRRSPPPPAARRTTWSAPRPGSWTRWRRCTGGPGNLVFLDTRSLAVEQVPFDPPPAGLALLVIDTQAPHALVDGEYAERRRSCEQAARDPRRAGAARRHRRRPRRRAGPARDGPTTCSASGCGTSSPRTPGCWTSSPRCGPAPTRGRSGRRSPPRTPRCATTSRSPCPRSTPRWRRRWTRARTARG